MADAVHTPAGGGAPDAAFGLLRRIHVEGDAQVPSVWEEDIPEGAGPPRHLHTTSAEVFVILSGRLLFAADGVQFHAGAGDTVVIPPGTVHAFKGAAPEGSVALITLSPGGGAGLFLEATERGLGPQTDPDVIAALGAKYDVEFAGPPL